MQPSVTLRGQSATSATSDLMVGSREQMVDIAIAVLDEFLGKGGPSLEELLATPFDDPGVARSARAAYSLMGESIRFSVRGVVSKVGRIQFAAMVRTGIQSRIKRLEDVWSADWQVVGASLENVVHQRQERRAKEDPAVEMAKEARRVAMLDATTIQKFGSSTPDVTQVHRPEVVDEDYLTVHIALADLSQRELFDPLSTAVPGNSQGGMFRFGETQRLVDLPRSLRKSRERATQVLMDYYGTTEAEAEDTSVPEHVQAAVLELAGMLLPEQIALALGLHVDGVKALLAEQAKPEKKPRKKASAPEALDINEEDLA